MHTLLKLSRATPATIRRELLETVDRLLAATRDGAEVLEELQHVRDLLDSLPLASDDYSTASNRLRNAHRYLVSEERGAARYELNLLAGSLRNGHVRPLAPHRQLRVADRSS